MSVPRDFCASRPSAGTGSSFPFGFPINSLNNLTQSLINTSSTLNNLMSNNTRPGNFSSQASTSSSMTREAACELCSTKFTVFKRRKQCNECGLDYCSACCIPFECYGNRQSGSRRRCRRCRIFLTNPLDRKALMLLRVRDLRWYLERRQVSSSDCKEKSELVDLVLRTNGYRVPVYGSQSNVASSYRNDRRESDPIMRQTTSGHDNDSSDPDSAWVLVEDDLDAGEASGLASEATGGATSSPRHSDGYSFTPTNDTSTSTSVKDTHEEANKSSEEFKVFNIDDISSIEGLHALSARQLKLILTRNFVDYKGCCQREELMDKVERLWREKKRVNEQNLDDIPDENLCKICMESIIDCVLLECGHMVSCVNCGKRLSECPICRQYVIRAVRIFKS